MNHQHEDGSWFYAEPRPQNWIDSFHTGFNLEALRRFINLGLGISYMEAYQRGREYYVEHFFEEDGTPKYYHDRLYLTDIHAPAEAICYFSGEGKQYDAFVDKILKWTIDNMFDNKTGLFYFRKSKLYTIKIPYMRWSEAWMFRALSAYVSKCHS